MKPNTQLSAELLQRYNTAGQARIIRAHKLAFDAHQGQLRASGDPYIVHPVAVAEDVAAFGCDIDTVIATLLHDTLEDTNITEEVLEKEFGLVVKSLVSGVTKLDNIRYTERQRRVESLRRMFLAVAEDIRVVIIKLFDRLHNMKTISALNEETQKRIALETLELYAPLAHRLGIGKLKGELDDLAFPIVYPEEYAFVYSEVKERMSERSAYLKKFLPEIRNLLTTNGIATISLDTRAKHYYSLWRKLLKHDMDFSRIHDLSAIRIILNDVSDCYRSLGIIHKSWKPLPGRIKDYIALPKSNGYRSLQTTIIGPENRVLEVQIRTQEMHDEAENGIAAHWAYDASGKSSKKKVTEHESRIIAELRHWQEQFDDADGEDFDESLKIDLFKNRIFVLTPAGEVLDLPEGATPVDFAYAVHTEIGERMSGAKVNGKMTAFNTPLVSGDTIEIMQSKQARPSPDWLDMARTSVARTRIRSYLKKSGIHLPIRHEQQQKEIVLTIRAKNRVGLIKDVSAEFVRRKINISDLETDRRLESHHLLTIRFEKKTDHNIDQLMTALKKIKGVLEVSRKSAKG